MNCQYIVKQHTHVKTKTKAAEFSLKTKTTPRLNCCETKFCHKSVKILTLVSEHGFFSCSKCTRSAVFGWDSDRNPAGELMKDAPQPPPPSRLERVYTFQFNSHFNYYHFPALYIASQCRECTGLALCIDTSLCIM